MENGRIKEKKNRQEFEHNLPGPSSETLIILLIASVSSGSVMMPFSSMTWPRKLILLLWNSHSCGLSVAPAVSICFRAASASSPMQ